VSVDPVRIAGLLPCWRPIRGGDRTLVAQLEDEIAGRIADHVLRPGGRLPSIRRMSETASVSRFTVIEAYERLVARGLVEARHGSGYYVRPGMETPIVAEAAPVTHPPPSRLDVAWLLRSTFSDGHSMESQPGAGVLPTSWLDGALVQRAVRAVGRATDDTLLGYGHPRGDPALRAQMAFVLQGQGIAAHPDRHLLTTAGVTHGLDWTCDGFVPVFDLVRRLWPRKRVG